MKYEDNVFVVFWVYQQGNAECCTWTLHLQKWMKLVTWVPFFFGMLYLQYSVLHQFSQDISSQESKATSYKIESHSFYLSLGLKKKKQKQTTTTFFFPNTEKLQAAFEMHIIDSVSIFLLLSFI